MVIKTHYFTKNLNFYIWFRKTPDTRHHAVADPPRELLARRLPGHFHQLFASRTDDVTVPHRGRRVARGQGEASVHHGESGRDS